MDAICDRTDRCDVEGVKVDSKAKDSVCGNLLFYVIVQTPVGGLPLITKYREELKIRGEDEYFYNDF